MDEVERSAIAALRSGARPRMVGDTKVKTSSVQVVSFAIGDDQYGVDIMAVREIKGFSKITNLPKQPSHVRGILNLRGVVVPIIDLRRRFDQGFTEASSVHVIIIVQIGERQVGLLADRVLDIVTFDATQLQAVPHVQPPSPAHFLSGIVSSGGTMMALIELANLVGEVPVEGESVIVEISSDKNCTCHEPSAAHPADMSDATF